MSREDAASLSGDAIEPVEPTEPDGVGDDRAAEAVFVLTALALEPEPLPAALRARLLAEAARPGVVPVATQREVVGAMRSWKMFGAGVGLAAAAAVLIGVSLVMSGPGGGRGGADLTTLAGVQQALGAAADVEELAFAPGVSELAGATGTVRWSDTLQAGTLTFTNLPANEPGTMQYQLWIVDPARDARPVDGGVFDVAGGGTVTVPVAARLRVNKPAAFAVTREKPGGVVVSAGPLVMIAARK